MKTDLVKDRRRMPQVSGGGLACATRPSRRRWLLPFFPLWGMLLMLSAFLAGCRTAPAPGDAASQAAHLAAVAALENGSFHVDVDEFFTRTAFYGATGSYFRLKDGWLDCYWSPGSFPPGWRDALSNLKREGEARMKGKKVKRNGDMVFEMEMFRTEKGRRIYWAWFITLYAGTDQCRVLTERDFTEGFRGRVSPI